MHTLQWKYHGGFKEPDLGRIVEQSSSIIIGKMAIEQRKVTEYSTGDVRIPVVSQLTVRFALSRVLRGQCHRDFLIKGRSRPHYPDPTLEDRFWSEWLEDTGSEVVAFLLDDDEILYMECLNSSRLEVIESLLKGQRKTEGVKIF